MANDLIEVHGNEERLTYQMNRGLEEGVVYLESAAEGYRTIVLEKAYT